MTTVESDKEFAFQVDQLGEKKTFHEQGNSTIQQEIIWKRKYMM